MKKSLVALATLAAATGAFAQSPNARAITGSNVEIFGVVDMAVSRVSATDAGSRLRMEGEGRNESSRLGFRGMEDMGGGWGAGFWLEAGMFMESGQGQNTTGNNTNYGQTGVSTGTNNAGASGASPDIPTLGGLQGLTFNRASTVSLINKDLGEFRLGRDYVPTFWNKTQFDPFGTVGVGAYTNLTYGTLNKYVAVSPPGSPAPLVRASNSIGWLSQNINGFRAQVMYALSEMPSACTDIQKTSGVNSNLCNGTADSGKYTGFRLTYTSGPLSLAAAQSTTKNPYPGVGTVPNRAGILTGFQGDNKDMNLAAAYQMGATRLMAQMGTQTFAATNVSANNGTSAISAPLPFDPVYTNGAVVGSTATAGVLSTTEWRNKTTLLGVTHVTGPWTLKASYATAKRTGGQGTYTSNTGGAVAAVANIEDGASQKQIAVGAVYDLSKRTAVYGTYSKLTAKGQNAVASMGLNSAAAVGVGGSVNTTGIDLGLRHRF